MRTLGLAVVAALALPGAAMAERGPRENYILRCTGCHGMEGKGSEIGGIPTFHDSVSTLARDDEGRTYMMHVPGVIGASLTDAEIAAVMNWVMEAWGDKADPAPDFTADEVTRRRAIPVGDVVTFRRGIAGRLEAAGTAIANYPWP